jgi:hypothetical protein
MKISSFVSLSLLAVLAGCASPAKESAIEPTPMTAGKSAQEIQSEVPLFALQTPDGKTLTLREQLAANKAVLINFWFHG